MAQIEIYTRAFCPYCSRALALLRGKQVNFVEHDTTMDGGLRHAMIERAGGRTSVPQIFIDGDHIGGCDDLVALDQAGRLDQMLGG